MIAYLKSLPYRKWRWQVMSGYDITSLAYIIPTFCIETSRSVYLKKANKYIDRGLTLHVLFGRAWIGFTIGYANYDGAAFASRFKEPKVGFGLDCIIEQNQNIKDV